MTLPVFPLFFFCGLLFCHNGFEAFSLLVHKQKRNKGVGELDVEHLAPAEHWPGSGQWPRPAAGRRLIVITSDCVTKGEVGECVCSSRHHLLLWIMCLISQEWKMLLSSLLFFLCVCFCLICLICGWRWIPRNRNLFFCRQITALATKPCGLCRKVYCLSQPVSELFVSMQSVIGFHLIHKI